MKNCFIKWKMRKRLLLRLLPATGFPSLACVWETVRDLCSALSFPLCLLSLVLMALHNFPTLPPVSTNGISILPLPQSLSLRSHPAGNDLVTVTVTILQEWHHRRRFSEAESLGVRLWCGLASHLTDCHSLWCGTPLFVEKDSAIFNALPKAHD